MERLDLLRWLVKLTAPRGPRAWISIGAVMGAVIAIVHSGNPVERPFNFMVGVLIGAGVGLFTDWVVSREERRRSHREESRGNGGLLFLSSRAKDVIVYTVLSVYGVAAAGLTIAEGEYLAFLVATFFVAFFLWHGYAAFRGHRPER